VLLFWNVSRLKLEGYTDPQFKLLSVGSIYTRDAYATVVGDVRALVDKNVSELLLS
jgi:hypothetical protein